MITLNLAKRLALEGVARVTGRRSDDLVILDEETQCKRTGWFFHYAARANVERRDHASALGNAGLVIVTHAAVVHVLLLRGRSEEEALADFERYRAECTTQH